MDDAAKSDRATWLLEEVLGKGFNVTAGLKTEAEGSDELTRLYLTRSRWFES